MDEELRCFIEQIQKRFEELLTAEMRRLADLRTADALAVEVAWRGVSDRMQGFPQQYATKAEQDSIKETAIRLERDSISREVYDQRHNQLTEQAAQSLPKIVFDSTLAEWSVWRSEVNQRLDQQAGSRQGISTIVAWALGSIGALAAAAGIVSILFHH